MGWVWVLCACTLCICTLRLKKKLPSVKNLTLNLLAIFCMALLIYLSGNFGLMATMVNLLVVAACLKLINLQTRADYHLVLIVIFFLIACGFIYHQSIYVVAYYFSCLVVLFVSAFILNQGKLSIPGGILQSGKMMLQALPITLLLFVVVPRLPPFWQTSIDKSTQTGLSEQITPGDIANLAQSEDLVFRAEFDEKIPPPQQRYWRSIILDDFDGKTWKVSDSQTSVYEQLNNSVMDENQALASNTYRYLLISEPTTTRWLFSLGIPQIEQTISEQSLYLSKQYQIFKPVANEQADMYILRSNLEINLNNFVASTDYARYLQTPKEGNELTKQWVEDNIQENMSFQEKLKVMNRFFINNNFEYTLKPPLMQTSPVDAFLFNHQRGFCSHYASALTYMLRLANIPARMVAGYQGGEQQGDSILSIYQYDAHAWVEAYNPDNGWQRYDPTALIAPNRAISGLLSALNEQDSILLTEDMNTWLNIPLLEGLGNYLVVLDHNWKQLFLEFNQDSQTSLVEKLFGELSTKTLSTFLLLTLVAIALFLSLVFLPYKRLTQRKEKPQLEKVLRLLNKNGLARHKNESLQVFHRRISPSLESKFNLVFERFIEAYYKIHYQENLEQRAKLDSIYQELRKEKEVLKITRSPTSPHISE